MKHLPLLFGLISLSSIAYAQNVKSIELRLISRDVSGEQSDPINFVLAHGDTTIASKMQFYEWKQAWPPLINMELSVKNLDVSQLKNCLFKVSKREAKDPVKFDCVLKFFVDGQKKPLKKRLPDVAFQGKTFPQKALDSVIFPLSIP